MRSKLFASLFALSALVSLAEAQTNVTPVLSAGNTACWYTDRYNPESFAVNNGVHGRNDVLQIGIGPTTDAVNRLPGQQGTFYNTQGKKVRRPDLRVMDISTRYVCRELLGQLCQRYRAKRYVGNWC